MVNNDRSLEQIITDVLEGIVVNEIKGVRYSINGTINKMLALILLTESLLSTIGQYTGSFENAVKAVTYYHNHFNEGVKNHGE